MGVDCYSVDMHRTLPRCFINGPVCGYLPPTPDANYDILQNTGCARLSFGKFSLPDVRVQPQSALALSAMRKE